MAWYDTGTVSVTNGSTTVTGSGTNFVAGAQVGEGFNGPDGRLYEIQSITSATVLVLADAYLGSTQSGQDYKIVPTQSLTANLASQVSTLITDYQDVADGVITKVKASDGTAGSPSISFNSDQDTGFFHDTANEIAVSVAGTKRAEFNSTGIDVTGTITTDGLDVTGTATMDGLTVDGLATISSTGPALKLNETDTTDKNTYLNTGGGTFNIQTVDDAGTGFTKRLSVSNGTGDISFYEDTGTTAKFFWDASAESLGIGTSSPSGILHLSATNPNLYITSADTGQSDILMGGTSDPDAGIIRYADNDDSMRIFTNNTERMRIDSSGNVGIGTSSPSAKLDVGSTADAEKTMTSSADGHFRVSGGAYSFAIANNSTGTYLYNNGSSRAMVFGVNETERMRIDSSGNLLVGSTNTTPAQQSSVTGISLRTTGAIETAANNGNAARFNRIGGDGSIIELRKDGSPVGSIRSRSGLVSTYIVDPRTEGNGGVGITATGNTSQPALLATDEAGTLTNGAISLGAAGERFKDLYLSGGVYLGGTGSANHLDDYESGSFTPSLFGEGSAGTQSYSVRQGYYKKVGTLVNVDIIISCTSSGHSGNMIIDGLPFAASGSRSAVGAFQANSGITFTSGYVPAWLNAGSTRMRCRASNPSGGNFQAVGMGSNVQYLRVNLSYHSES